MVLLCVRIFFTFMMIHFSMSMHRICVASGKAFIPSSCSSNSSFSSSCCISRPTCREPTLTLPPGSPPLRDEVQSLKKKILREISEHGIRIYSLPECDADEDEDYKAQVQDLRDSIPFAVVGANTMVEVGGKKIRGRQYPWGVVEVENPNHCDFIKLRTMLITHMQDLQEVTHDVHYENYRSQRLAREEETSGFGWGENRKAMLVGFVQAG